MKKNNNPKRKITLTLRENTIEILKKKAKQLGYPSMQEYIRSLIRDAK